MRSLAKTRTAGPLAPILAALCCAAATSALAADGLVINEQILLGDVFSEQTLNVEEAPEGVSAASTAVGNIVSATGQESFLNFQSAQTIAQHVEASNNVTVNGATGEFFFVETSATGNSGTAGTCCEMTLGSSMQTISQGAVIAADSASSTGDVSDSISVDSTAIANTQGWNQIGGEVDSWTRQDNDGLTSATNIGDFHSSTGNIGLGATAVANNVTVDAEDAYVDVGIEQSRRGQGAVAVVNATIGSGTDVQGIATVTGNLVDAQTSGPEVAMGVQQSSAASLDAYTDLDLQDWSGDANSIAYGVGNSVLLANVGPVTSLSTAQTSGGDVNATASFTGGSGNAAFVSSTAIGNAVSGYACNECDGEFGAFNRQVNSSRTRSVSNVVITGRTGLISAESTAVGNSATYQVFSNGGDN